MSSDYLYAPNLCYETSAPYILLVEDDIIIADSWFAKTRKAIRDIGSKPDPFIYLYLRLFYAETSMKWRVEDDFWYRRMDLTLALGACTTAFFLLIFRRFTPNMKRCIDSWTILVLSLVTIPAFITLAFMIGKYSLFPPNGVFKMN